MIFTKTAQTLFSNRVERETHRGTPQVNGPHTSVTREQRRDLTAGDLGDGQEYHRAPRSTPHRLVPETLTLPHPRDLALANGGTAVVCGRPSASLVRDRAKEDSDEHQHDSTELLGQVLGILNANRKNPQAHGYRCSLHSGVFQSIDFPQGT